MKKSVYRLVILEERNKLVEIKDWEWIEISSISNRGNYLVLTIWISLNFSGRVFDSTMKILA